MAYRWTRHRILDEAGNDESGIAAISLWWVARAAAEETLQGAPLVASWLKLFATHLSTADTYWLRWRGDLAESAELRRAYSGLYGRFFARALLSEHLGLSRFLSLQRNGLSIPGSAEIVRTQNGDIPDWIAWDDKNSRFVLGEAKGSLSASDFLTAAVPKCVHAGKCQFDRVETRDGGQVIQPARWVAATRWATDRRSGHPVTILWDPPVDGKGFSEEDALRHRTAIGRAWLNSIAPALGWSGAEELMSADRLGEAIVIHAEPRPEKQEGDWDPVDDPSESSEFLQAVPSPVRERVSKRQTAISIGDLVRDRFTDTLGEVSLYRGRDLLEPPQTESKPHAAAYVAAVITRFGVRPVRTPSEFEALQRDKERAEALEEPAMIVGLPVGFDPSVTAADKPWLGDGGIAGDGKLALFDLRRVSAERVERTQT